MILVIDAGNTIIVAAIMENDAAVYVKRYATGKEENCTYHYNVLSEFFCDVEKKTGSKITDLIQGAIVSSVVPSINIALKRAVKECLHLEALFVSNKLDTGLDIKYDYPEKLGADLIAGAAGAVFKFGCPVIMIDIGTATTFSVVNSKGQYLGGAICPGPYTSLKALTNLAAQLPVGTLGFTDKIIGTNTTDCMSIGAFTAHAAMIDGMIDRILAKIEDKNVVIVATGGPAREITAMCTHKVQCDRDLVLYGLSKLYFRNTK